MPPTEAPASTAAFAAALLDWSEAHGRRDLPWQQDPTPYRVWVSEVMLQQTQVTTVASYFPGFMSTFPCVQVLAEAGLDEVLHAWTGLGYYARARNLHRSARIVMERHGGNLPEDFETLRTLPGVGRSTAGAILALSCSRRHAILDGNARRVLARYFGVEGQAGRPETERALWSLAEACTPLDGVARYTQAIMDLGATVCTRSAPACEACPLTHGCLSRATGRQAVLPARRPRRQRPHRRAVALIVVRADGSVLLTRQPAEGLWGGLWTLPMFESEEEATAWFERQVGSGHAPSGALPAYKHSFTHFDLTLHPVVVRAEAGAEAPAEALWYERSRPARIGLSKPAVDLMATLAKV
jgi:A/G-specific adenine glycosylase